MIASLRGTIESFGADWVVIDVHGVGYLVYAPGSTMSTLGAEGEEVYLQTHMVVRDDSLTLYGFATAAELELFEVLTGVSGLGPRLGLAVLSTMSAEQAISAIAGENTDLLTAVPGIGRKLAQRLVLELKDKLSAGLTFIPGIQVTQENTDVIAALTSLGYSVAEASRAVASLPAGDRPLEENVRLALQYFAVK